MDPKDEVRLQGFVVEPAEFPNELPEGVKKDNSYYAYRTQYADGREVWTWYKRNTGPKVAEGQPAQDPVITTDTKTIPRIADEFNKRTQPSASSAATAARDTVTVNGKVMQWNPQTQRYDIEVGTAGTGAVTGAPTYNREPVEGRPGVFIVKAGSKDPNGVIVTDTYYTDADGNRIAPPTGLTEKETTAKDEAKRKEDETKANQWTEISRSTDENTGKTVATFRNGLGKTEEREVSVTKKTAPEDTWRDPKTNRLYAITRDANGSVTGQREISGTGDERPTIPTSAELGQARTEMGSLVPDAIARRDKLTELFNAGGMDQKTYDTQARQIMDDANSRYTELSGLLSAQNTITGQQAGQRRDTISQANNATVFANSALERSMKPFLQPAAGIYGPGAGETAVKGIQGLLSMHNEALRTTPGFSTPDPIANTAFQQGILGANPYGAGGGTTATITPGGVVSINTGGAGGGATPAPNPTPNLTNIAGSLSQGLPQVPGGGFLPPGNSGGLSFEGGQLRAPGAAPGGPDYSSLIQHYMEPDDQDWNTAISQVANDFGGGAFG